MKIKGMAAAVAGTATLYLHDVQTSHGVRYFEKLRSHGAGLTELPALERA
jgi:hypothetical protein